MIQAEMKANAGSLERELFALNLLVPAGSPIR